MAEQFDDPDDSVDWQEAVELMAQIAEAVHYAHSQGVFHRDLKPANILLVPKRNSPGVHNLSAYAPRVTDFGLSKLADANLTDTRSSLLIGTPLYMAPEQIDRTAGRGSESATDVYSLGVILFELLAGRPPVEGESYIEVLDGIRTKPTPRLRKLRPELPACLEHICLRCLQKNPAARYQSAADLASDLRRCAAGESILCDSLSLIDRAKYWCTRPKRITEAGWFVVWMHILWTIWLVTFIGFIQASGRLSAEDMPTIWLHLALVLFIANLPMLWIGWRTVHGARWAARTGLALTLFNMPGYIISLFTKPIFFTPLYSGDTPWLAFSVYFMLITCYVFQAAYFCCALAAMRENRLST